ncbi:hypothetical protein BJ138DRAFT_902864 [Hygrophoropsis aurantiaca]|uniref:Uncharacterized protein n=1 Tax=Hygrophoropsis aurantiaca TaxID=72124 RepID=A0ACB8AE51_9AGAM|nr:hypothetical protein BJ138DRAFT_902864 [Hygrophoropsis aurantiaca]
MSAIFTFMCKRVRELSRHSSPLPSYKSETITHSILSSYIIIMCYWRRVRNTYKVCGHVINLPDEEIKCDLPSCKFSRKHPPNCGPPHCSKTCWQYHQYPQQYSMSVASFMTARLLNHIWRRSSN